MDMEVFFPAERTQDFQAPIKLAQQFPAPEFEQDTKEHLNQRGT